MRIWTVYQRFHECFGETCGLRGAEAGEEQRPMIAPSSPTVRRRRKRTPAPLATSAPDRNSMVAATMQLERHERGIHAVCAEPERAARAESPVTGVMRERRSTKGRSQASFRRP